MELRFSKRPVPIGEADRSSEGRGHTALVTGASAGIGRSLCELLAAKGYDLVPVARRAERLKELKVELEERWSVSVEPIVADLGETSTPRDITDELSRRGTTVDFLVNNAGCTLSGWYAEVPWDEEERFLRVMGLSPLELTRYLLPAMVEQRWGRVLNITSVSGVMSGTPRMVLYSASKSLVNKFTEGLAAEYEPHGIHCTVSMPGATDTEFIAANGMTDLVASNRFVRAAMMSPETVARQAYDACMAGRRLTAAGWQNKVWAFAVCHAPPAVRYKLAAISSSFQMQ